jgi:tetratricopeptide (TPR) repeat protein
MPSIESLRVPPPSNWQDFEHLCWLLWHDELGDRSTQKNGRQGQEQHGVDVFGQRRPGYWVGIQCKGKDDYRKQRVTEDELRTEVSNARRFSPAISEFILATTGPRDAKLQVVARTLTEEHQKTGHFSVRVCAWDDIKDLLGKHPSVISHFYGGAAFAANNKEYLDKFDQFGTTLLAELRNDSNRKETNAQELVSELRILVAQLRTEKDVNATPGLTASQIDESKRNFDLNGQMGVANRSRMAKREVLILSASRQRILGLIAISPLSFSAKQLRLLFPEINWREAIRYFAKHHLVQRDGDGYLVNSHRQSELFKEATAKQAVLNEWISRLMPLRAHPDTALFLAIQKLRSGEFVTSIEILVEGAESLLPGYWTDTYLEILLKVDRADVLKKFTHRQHVQYLNSVALCLSRQHRHKEALVWYERLRRVSKRVRSNWGIGQSYHNAGVTLIEMKDFVGAEKSLQFAVQHSRRTRDSFLLGRSLYELGLAVLESDISAAQAFFEASEKIKAKNGDDAGLVGVHHGRAVLAVGTGNYRDALAHFRAAERTAKRIGDIHGQALERFNIGRTLIDLGDYDDALVHLRAAKQAAIQDALRDVQVLAQGGEAIALTRSSRFSKAEIAFRELFRLHSERGDKKIATIASHDIGVCLLKQKKFTEARQHLSVACKQARRNGMEDWVLQCQLDIAASYAVEGDVGEAVKQLRTFAKAEERRRDHHNAAKLWLAIVPYAASTSSKIETTDDAFFQALNCASRLHGNNEIKLGILVDLHHWQWKNLRYLEAISTLRRILKITVKSKNSKLVCMTRNQLGVCLQEMDRYKEALRSQTVAVQLARRLKEKELLETALNNLGEALRKVGRHARAAMMLKEAERLAAERGDKAAAIAIAHNRGLVLQYQERFDEAEATFKQCCNGARRLRLWGEYVRGLHALANLEWHKGNPQKALTVYEKAMAVADLHEDTSRFRAQLCANYANALRWVERPEKAIAILKKAESLFKLEPDAFVYHSELASAYEEIGDLENAKAQWKLVEESARLTNNKAAIAKGETAIAGLNAIIEKAVKTEQQLRTRITNERDPELQVDLLVELLKVVIQLRKDKEVREIVAKLGNQATVQRFPNKYVDALLLVAEHNCAIESSMLDGLKAFTVAMTVASRLNDDRFFIIGAMIAERLCGRHASPDVDEIDSLRESTLRWLIGKMGLPTADRPFFEWPFSVAKRVAIRQQNREELSDVEWENLLSRESTSACKSESRIPRGRPA